MRSRRKRSIEKKEALKKAAVELFSTKGFHNTSSNEIAKKANVSIGTFYSYFVDKIKHLCKNGSELKEAIDTAVRECIKEGVLTDQLTYLGSEVMGMFATEFDMDEAVKVWKEEAREEGLEEGREELPQARPKITVQFSRLRNLKIILKTVEPLNRRENF